MYTLFTMMVMVTRWRKVHEELEAERRKNKHFMEQLRVVEQKLENAWKTYDKLSHSWPFPTPEISEEEHQKIVDGFWRRSRNDYKRLHHCAGWVFLAKLE